MNEPKRWSSPSSDVDPVLRSVLRYARELEPNSLELRTVVHGTVARHRPISASWSRRRSKAWVLVALAATFATGAALASYASRLWFAPSPPAPTPTSVAPAKGTTPLAPASAGMEPAPRPEPSVAPASPGAMNRAARVRATPSATVSAPRALDAAQDAALLQEARSLVASNPARALSLARDHELRFPNSALMEERQALRIEALTRLGRHAEAEGELLTFDQRFPRSIYAHRLHQLLR